MLIDLTLIPVNQQAGIGSIHISADDRMVWFEQTIEQGAPSYYVHCGNSAFLVTSESYASNLDMVRQANDGVKVAKIPLYAHDNSLAASSVG